MYNDYIIYMTINIKLCVYIIYSHIQLYKVIYSNHSFGKYSFRDYV